MLSDGNDQRILNRATEISRLEKLPIVACGNVHMHNVERKPLQDLLTAIRIRTPIMDAGSQLFKNAENHLRHLNVIKDRYPSELIEQTMVISDTDKRTPELLLFSVLVIKCRQWSNCYN